jgi:hypothetical protein
MGRYIVRLESLQVERDGAGCALEAELVVALAVAFWVWNQCRNENEFDIRAERLGS